FGDRGRHSLEIEAPGEHVVSVGYLALTRSHDETLKGAAWRDWYQHFPWEDWRDGKPAIIEQPIVPLLREWGSRQAEATADALSRGLPRDGMRLWFGVAGVDWGGAEALGRYEPLCGAGRLPEAARDGRPNALAPRGKDVPPLGRPMQFARRRIL